jgi:uncharacterized protein (DUF2235 family)
MGKNIVICLDGTSNEPEKGKTNVVRLYEILSKNEEQVAYYDPGVGTMGARSATSRFGKGMSRVGGLAFGHGVKQNVEEAYKYLMYHYEDGDRIYVFGFSRGAYTARALVGMLRTVGLLRPGSDNLIPYAMKLYTKKSKDDPSDEEEKQYWADRTDFNTSFGNPDFPNRFAPQVHFLGIWDTVKFVGWLNWRAQFQQARWPFTRKVSNVVHGRHALAIDEKRRYYAEYRFDEGAVDDPKRDLSEVWFAGVHSDVGGTFPDDHRLADITLQWMVNEAKAQDLQIDDARYEKHIGVPPGSPLAPETVEGLVHTNGMSWFVLGAGWRMRKMRPSDNIHPSVEEKMKRTADSPNPYRPNLPERS